MLTSDSSELLVANGEWHQDIDQQTGALLRSDNNGVTFEKLTATNRAVHEVMQDATDADVIYAAVSHDGILKSTDRGQTWFGSADGLGQ
ncbi:MAG: hypothetical protein HYV63_20385 [Candidatus Schekmanbacteria bacterium]|nr:hypothetical protein [Candidatus Schekmanbacteria bacterium]